MNYLSPDHVMFQANQALFLLSSDVQQNGKIGDCDISSPFFSLDCVDLCYGH